MSELKIHKLTGKRGGFMIDRGDGMAYVQQFQDTVASAFPLSLEEEMIILLCRVVISSTPNAKIQEIIDRCRKREKDNRRPPFEQEAYAGIAYNLEQLIK